MRDLETINSAAKSTKHIFTVSLIIPIIMGWGAWALAMGAAPGLALRNNHLALLGLGITALGIIALPIPYLFKWNWEAKYFGAGIWPFCTGSIVGIYPIACITTYSSLPLITRLTFALFETILIFWWCSRFTEAYRKIYLNKDLFHYIYVEEATAVYYLQQADKKVIDKLLKFEQFPGPRFTMLPMLLAFSLIPFASTLSRVIGLPFIHIFLAISMMPINLMFFGLCTKGWLIFYVYPTKIKKQTNKPVYVDKSSHPQKFVASTPSYIAPSGEKEN